MRERERGGLRMKKLGLGRCWSGVMKLLLGLGTKEKQGREIEGGEEGSPE